MGWFFNSDFEDFLKSDQEKYTIQSTKKNQEFEYFILWLENDSLFTEKKYDDEYLDYIKTFNICEITRDKKNIKLWCSEIFDKKKQREINSKIETTKFGINHGLCHSSTEVIEDKSLYIDGYLYKEAFGVSGDGNFTYSANRKISLPLVRERELERTFDFSALVRGDQLVIYQNHIDGYYQYRGTTVGLNFEYFDWLPSYKDAVALIQSKFQFKDFPLSIDSFLYREEGVEKCYVLSEVNNRKTMGYIAHKLKDKLFPNSRYSKLILAPSKKLRIVVDQKKISELFEQRVILLSPKDTYYCTFLICEESLGELNELEDLVLSTFFEGI